MQVNERVTSDTDGDAALNRGTVLGKVNVVKLGAQSARSTRIKITLRCNTCTRRHDRHNNRVECADINCYASESSIVLYDLS